jgi:hypothetical protein
MTTNTKMNELSFLTTKALNMAELLPRAGHFEPSKDILNLVRRRDFVQKLHKALFQLDSFESFAVSQNWKFSEYGDVEISFKKTQKGFRFAQKSNLFMECVIEDDNHIYNLIIPIHKENSELYLYGIMSVSEPSSFLEWSEYGFIVKSKISNKESKIHLRFQYSLCHGENENIRDINPVEYFCLCRLEDAALLVFSRLNQYRLNQKLQTTSEINATDMELFSLWTKMLTNCESQNKIDRNKPNLEITITDQWETFDGFAKWALANGFQSGLVLARTNIHSGYDPTNCFWVDHPIPERRLVAERYYVHYFNNERYSATDVATTPVTINGELKSVYEWSKISGLTPHVILGRVFSGLKDKAIIAPLTKEIVEFTHKLIEINGITKTAKQWSEDAGISLKTMVSRIRYGWVGDALISPSRTRLTEKG